jgi:hypothetical protein
MSKKTEIRDMVHHILTTKPETRDNDMYLVASYWYKQLQAKGQDLKNISALDFLTFIRDYKSRGITSFESISRQRRLLQEMHPELRGKEYEKRHATQDNVKQDIKDYKAESTFITPPVFEQQPKLF